MEGTNILAESDEKAYSRLKHLAMALSFSRWRRSLMAMFTVYFDASGSGTQGEALSVAGFLARTDEWIKFEKSWKIVLNAYKVKSLHMKEFAPGSGEFASWKDDKKRRQEFLQDLIGVISARCLNSFVSCIMLEPYRQLDKTYPLSEMHKPLALTGANCIYKVAQWAKRNNVADEKFLFVFEDGDTDKSDLIRYTKECFGFTPSFMGKLESVAFQAADLLAYEHRRANQKIFQYAVGTLGLEDLRGSLQELHKTTHEDEDWGIYSEENLERLCSEMYPPRQKVV